MDKDSKDTIILTLTFLITAGLLGTGYYYLFAKQNKTFVNNDPASSPNPETIATADENEDKLIQNTDISNIDEKTLLEERQKQEKQLLEQKRQKELLEEIEQQRRIIEQQQEVIDP